MQCDVLIVGAGPAGLFAASELAGHMKVIIIDKTTRIPRIIGGEVGAF